MNLLPIALLRISEASFDTLADLVLKRSFEILTEVGELESLLSTQRLLVCSLLHKYINQCKHDGQKKQLLNLRRDIYNNRNIIVYDQLLDLFDVALRGQIAIYKGLQHQVKMRIAVFNQQYVTELQQIKANFKRAINTPSFLNGLLLSSKDLYEQVEKYLNEGTSGLSNKKITQVEAGLLKYYSRMIAKISPLGAFTSVSFMDLNAESGVLSSFNNETKSFVRLNNYYYRLLVSVLKKYPPFYEKLGLKLNESLSVIDGNAVFLVNHNNSESLQSTPLNDTVDVIVKLFKTGTIITFNEIVRALKKRFNSSVKDLKTYLNTLLEYGLLEQQLDTNFKVENWPLRLAAELELKCPKDALLKWVSEELKKAVFLLQQFGETKVTQVRAGLLNEIYNTLLAAYGRIHEQVGLPEYERTRIVPQAIETEHVRIMEDTPFKIKHYTFFNIVQERILFEDSVSFHRLFPSKGNFEDAAGQLQKLISALYIFKPAQHPFRNTIKSLLRNQDEIPFLDFYTIHHQQPPEDDFFENGFSVVNNWTAKFADLVRKKMDSDEVHQIDINLEEIHEINGSLGLSAQKSTFSNSYSAFIQFLYSATAEDPLFVLNENISMGYGKYFSRFISYAEPYVLDRVRKENRSAGGGYIFATCNDGSYFNANVSPALMDFELLSPGSKNSVQVKGTLSITDLYLRYDLLKDEPFLYSKTFDKRVLFFDLSFQSIATRSALYKLLARFTISHNQNQVQNLLTVIDHEADLLKRAGQISKRPRVTIDGKFVIKRRNWVLSNENFPLINKTDSAFEKFSKIWAWQQAAGLPDEFMIRMKGDDKKSGDNRKPQYINIKSPLFLNILKSFFHKPYDYVVYIEEFFPGPADMYIGKNGKYVTEHLIQWNH